MFQWYPFDWSGSEFVYPGILTLGESFLAAGGYWISRGYAERVVAYYDGKTYDELPGGVKSEAYLITSQGYASFPLLIIPDLVGTSFINPYEIDTEKFEAGLLVVVNAEVSKFFDGENEFSKKWSTNYYDYVTKYVGNFDTLFSYKSKAPWLR
jgi:hypothetical protein